jgi:hypothetical protein
VNPNPEGLRLLRFSKEMKMRRNQNRNKATGSARDLLAVVFPILRKRGYLARMNFSCCGSCAGYELASKAGELAKKGKPPTGCAFWHHQDEDSYQRSGRLVIRYGQLESSEMGKIGKDTKAIGEEIVALIAEQAALLGNPVEVEWDGDPNSVIWVADAGSKEREAEEERRVAERQARWEAEQARWKAEKEAEATRFLGEGI